MPTHASLRQVSSQPARLTSTTSRAGRTSRSPRSWVSAVSGIPALLRQAEAEGTVSYLINPQPGWTPDRSDRVREKYSLAEALIPTSTLPTRSPHSPPATYENCWSAAPWSVFPGVS